MSKKRIIIKALIVVALYGFYGTFDQVTGVVSIIGLSTIESNQELNVESWVYDLIFYSWLYDHFLVLGLLIAVFFKYELSEPFRKLIKNEKV